MFGLLKFALNSIVTTGRLTLIDPSGNRHQFGDGSEPEIELRIADRQTALRIAVNPDLYLGEAYMDGKLEVRKGSLYDLLMLAANNLRATGDRPSALEYPSRMRSALTRLQVLRTRLEAARGNNAGLDESYTRQLVQKLARPDD